MGAQPQRSRQALRTDSDAGNLHTFDGATVRITKREDGEPWFVAADLLGALELDRKALERLDPDEKGTDSIRTPGGTQEMTVVNESGLYSLILGSRKAEAKRFKKWITSEVLPSIRKTGRYSHQPADPMAALRRRLDGDWMAIGCLQGAASRPACGAATWSWRGH